MVGKWVKTCATLKEPFYLSRFDIFLKPFNPENLISRCGEKFGFEINTLLVRLHGVYPRKKFQWCLVTLCSGVLTHKLNCVSKGNTRTPCSGQMISNQSVIKYFIRSVCWIFFFTLHKLSVWESSQFWRRLQVAPAPNFLFGSSTNLHQLTGSHKPV